MYKDLVEATLEIALNGGARPYARDVRLKRLFEVFEECPEIDADVPTVIEDVLARSCRDLVTFNRESVSKATSELPLKNVSVRPTSILGLFPILGVHELG